MVSDHSSAIVPDFATIFDSLPGMYVLLSPELRVLAVTDTYLECLEITRNQAIGKPLAELFGRQAKDNVSLVSALTKLMNAALAKAETQTGEGIFRGPVKAGSLELCNRSWHITFIPITDDKGELNCILHLATDTQDQKTVELELKNTTEQFRFLADSIPQLIWTTDPEGSHEYFNQRWTEFTGFTLKESVGPDMWNNLLHPDDRIRARETWNHSLKTGEPYEIEYRFKSAANGKYYWFLGQALPMHDDEGKILKWFGTCTDISRNKQIEQELQEKNNELKLINDDLDSFVYMASHDLKLPLININTLFEELMPNVEYRDPEAEVMVGLIRNSLKQMHDTINDLSEIVKVQKNIFAHQETIKLDQLLNEVTLGMSELISSAGARIEADFSKAPLLHFSRINLKSVLYNLLSNAVKFRSPDRSPIISLKTNKTNEGVCLEVSDNGVGIDLNKHGDKLFQMFKRFHSHIDGSGLGLHIISRIMHKSGGRIEVTSNPGEGTTFSLIFAKHTHRHV